MDHFKSCNLVKWLTPIILFLVITLVFSDGGFFRVRSIHGYSTSITKNYSLLEYNFPWPPYNLTPPWRSAMTQAVALQALIKANEITGNATYLNHAKELLNAFLVEVKNGGVTYKTPDNGWWFELYAGQSRIEPRVLNGMLVSVLGIYDYYNYTKDMTAKFLFGEGLQALKHDLAYYDVNQTYTYYDLCCKNLSPLPYHKLVVDSLNQLYAITKDPFFKFYHDRWANYTIPALLLKIKQSPGPHVIYDPQGIPILDYGSVKGTYIGLQRNPLTIGHTALRDYELFSKTGDVNAKSHFINNVNWLVNNSVSFRMPVDLN